MMKLYFKVLFLLGLTCLGTISHAQQYPDKPIRLVSPIPPGGAPDLVARALGNTLSKQLGLSVYVENRVGSNGNIAADVVSHSPADGYTLLVGMDSLFVINPYLYTRNSDPNKEFLPVSTLASNEFVLAINPKVPASNLKEFVAYVKKTSPAPAYASGGNGSQHHLTMEMLKAKAGMEMLHVPYKGGVEATTATMGGDSIAMFSGTSNAGLIKSGKLKAIAVSGSKRAKDMPDVPTIAETYPGFDNTIWIGLFAVKGTPDAIVQKLRLEVAKALKDPAYIEALNKAGGIESFPTTPDEFLALIKKDQNKYKAIIKDTHLQLD